MEGESIKTGFDGGIKVEFHGAKVTSDGGLLAYRDLDDALGYITFQMSEVIIDKRLFAEILVPIEQLHRSAG